MTLSTDSFEKELEMALKEAKLPTDLRRVVGRYYRIGYERGSHHVVLVGTVVGVELSDEGSVIELYVSSPKFRGDNLDYLYFTAEEGWKVRTSHGAEIETNADKIEFALLY